MKPHEALLASVLQAPALNLDGKGWATAGAERTIWIATTLQAAVFRIATDRHRDRLNDLIGEAFAGSCCSDCWWAYDHLDPSADKSAGGIIREASAVTPKDSPPTNLSANTASR